MFTTLLNLIWMSGLSMIQISVSFLVSVMFISISWETFHPENAFYFTKTFELTFLNSTLILLTLMNLFSCGLALYLMKSKQAPLLAGLLGGMTLICFYFFMALNWITFYILFEVSLIPIFLIILGWGYQSERLKAAITMMIYTISGSLPLLFVIMNNSSVSKEYFFQSSCFHTLANPYGLLGLSLILAFLIKLPMFLCHMWLPKAHVEAPVVGSMFLAAILLKLGGYGLLKVKPLINPSSNMIALLSSVALWSLFYISMLCVQLTDIKVLVAFSSVSHMAMVLTALASANLFSVKATLMILLSHGFSSSLMFFQSYVLYLSFNSRSLLLLKNTLNFLGLWLCLWTLSVLAMMCAPPSLNLWVEISVIVSTMSFIWGSGKIYFWSVFLAGVYCFILLAGSYGGNYHFIGNYSRPLFPIDLQHMMFYIFYLVLLLLALPFLSV